jgi:hypothetical protein
MRAGVNSFPTSPQYNRGWVLRMAKPLMVSVRKLNVTIQ